MLIEFSVGNFLSIKDRQTLRLDASSISEHREQLIDAGRYQLLRSAVIYGANASGKSNVLKAIAMMRSIVEKSAQYSSTTEIEIRPFLLSTQTEAAPSYFEALFLVDGIRYRYGFEVDQKLVKAEWLFIARKEQEKPLFLRENDDIDVSKDFKEGKGIKERTRDNALFLSVCDQFNGSIAKQIMSWFSRVTTISGVKHEGFRHETDALLVDERRNKPMLTFLNQLNLGFEHIHTEDVQIDISDVVFDTSGYQSKFNSDWYKTLIRTIHSKYNEYNKVIGEEKFNLDIDESAGTQKLFDLVGPIFQVLQKGGILVVDELDAKLHPLMTQAIIRLFNQPELNPNNAQLIFATHDTNLLSGKLFRRDQIYFTEKDQYGATCLYSLVEYKEEDGTKIRKDRSFEEDYIQGRYGAIPFIGDLSKLSH